MKVKNCIPLTTVTRIYYLYHIRESIHERRVKTPKEMPVFLAVVTNDVFLASVSLGCGVPPLPSPELPPKFSPAQRDLLSRRGRAPSGPPRVNHDNGPMFL